MKNWLIIEYVRVQSHAPRFPKCSSIIFIYTDYLKAKVFLSLCFLSLKICFSDSFEKGNTQKKLEAK